MDKKLDDRLREIIPQAFLGDIEAQRDLDNLLLQCARAGYDLGFDDMASNVPDARDQI